MAAFGIHVQKFTLNHHSVQRYNSELLQNRDKREDMLVYIGNWNNSN